MKKFFGKIETYMLKLRIRFHKKSGRLGRAKRTDMGRLLSGEFFKFAKGGTFKVSVIVLILSMILTVSIYDPNGGIMDLASRFMGGTMDTDVFAGIDGLNDDLLSIAGELGVGIPAEAMSLMDEYFGDDEKVKYLSVSPKEYYKSINPARFFEDALRENYGFSDEMTEFILENRNFLKLILTTDTLMKAVQDFAAGNSSPLANDIVKLAEDNAYIIGVVVSVVKLAEILSGTPALTNVEDVFEKLKDPAEKDEYRLAEFYGEFLGALMNYQGEVTPLNIADVIKECYEKTRLYTAHKVSAGRFFTEVAPNPFDFLVFCRDIYASGIIGALFMPEAEVNFAFADFLLNAAVMAALPYEFKEGEKPDGYDGMSDAEKADVLKNAKFESVKEYIFAFLSVNYPGFYAYFKSLPLFDPKTLSRLVPEDYLRAEILQKAPYILDVYVEMITVLAADSGDNYKGLMDFALYFAIMGDLHDTLYGNYFGNMVGLRNIMIRVHNLLDYFYNDGNYGKSSRDFIQDEIVSLGRMFEELLSILNEEPVSPEEQLQTLTDKLADFNWRYQDLALYVWAGRGEVTLGLYSGESAVQPPEHYEEFEKQWQSFSRSLTSVKGVLDNPSKSTAVKLENVRRLITNMYNNANGFFSDVGRIAGKPIEESMTKFFDAFSELRTAVIDKEFFEENYAVVQEKLKEAFSAYFTVFKDRDFVELGGIYWLFEGEEAERMQNLYNEQKEFTYPEFRDTSRTFTRLAGLINDYVVKVYMIEVTESEDLNDKELSEMYGMMSISVMGMSAGITKYSTKSDIQKDRFYFENMELYGKLSSPGSLDNGYGFMSFGLNFAYLFVIVVIIIIASGTVAGEYETGSIKLLLIRPYRRWKFLTAKILFVAICLAVMMVFTYLFMLLIASEGLPSWEGWQGLSSRDVLVIFDASFPMVLNPFLVITLEYAFFYVHIFMYALIGVVVSTIAKSRVASVAASGGVFFAANILSAILSSYSWYRFIIFNNTNLFVYMSGGSSLGDMTMGLSALVYGAYLVLLLGASYFIFEKRDAV
ncbi:MAG: ABC transporter permease [Clostridiales bacterium]|jgi:ABC-2 type transport system permease protein|nr:ABC transporter permease [Clostridiales bacterium]